VIQIALFIFISIAFLGSTWGLYVGAAVFFSPLVPWLFADKIPKSSFVTRWKPKGLVNWTWIIVAGVLLSRLLEHLIHGARALEVAGFILLPLPVLISWALELFEEEETEDEHGEAESAEGTLGEVEAGIELSPILAMPSRERLAASGTEGPHSLVTAKPSDGPASALASVGSRERSGADSSPYSDLKAGFDGAERPMWRQESSRGEFRDEEAVRRADQAHDREANDSAWLAWLRRLAGVPLVVVSVYLVVTHIAGG
jgi:hypothetical protein